ncbi:hypothetical protein K1718_05360 [Roseibium porphyridii]|uniref:Fimbrial protein n=1 Tax=Roseibium porphyridii TaxID=2866279 RepID=A0ABY8F5L5_9HYPH|nr:hypothetical protein [Roseibium sp. KMA01]WFE90775.1 hypothetical protein K1718_05360 [Roseibium sp. KMA01]
MSQPDFREDADEAPLDPAAQKLQVKLRRLLLGSSLIMFAGLIAVFAAILYKINTNDDGPAEGGVAATVAVGPDAEVLSADLSDGMLLVLVREGTKTALLRFDALTGKNLGRTDFVSR